MADLTLKNLQRPVTGRMPVTGFSITDPPRGPDWCRHFLEPANQCVSQQLVARETCQANTHFQGLVTGAGARLELASVAPKVPESTRPNEFGAPPKQFSRSQKLLRYVRPTPQGVAASRGQDTPWLVASYRSDGLYFHEFSGL